jgi:hypothetical protein
VAAALDWEWQCCVCLKKTHASRAQASALKSEVSDMRITSNILTSCFLLTAYGTDLAPPPGICSAPEALTNVRAYQTPQSTAKLIVGLTGFTDRPVSPGRPRSYPQENSAPLVRLATSPRPPPRFTDSIDVQRNPNLCTDHADPTPNICSAEHESVLIRSQINYPASHDTGTSEMENFMKRLTGDVLTHVTDGPKEDTLKPELLTPGQKHMWILFTQKNFPKNICGYGPQLFYTMTRTCTTPAYHSNSPPPPPPPPMSFCCELLYIIKTVFIISAVLFLSTACVLRFAKRFDKLTGVKVPCRELLFIFLTLFPTPGAAATQGLADQRPIPVVVYTNASASTSMVSVNTVTNWTQLVTACAASANITLSPTFKMGAYTNPNGIDFDGKVIIIFGSNATLDAGQKGRFFIGHGSKRKTSLELHDITLINGKVDQVIKLLMLFLHAFKHI